jgi:hypothetical protein
VIEDLAQTLREPLLVVTGEHSRTAAAGFMVFGGLLIAESRMASFAAAVADHGEGPDHHLIAVADQHGVYLVANIILEAIVASNTNWRASGMGVVGAQAKTIARQGRRPLRSLDGEAALLLVPAASRLIAVLARGLGALEEGRADPDIAAVAGLFPCTSTGQRYRAALSTRPDKITVTQYRNRYHRLIKAVDALSG